MRQPGLSGFRYIPAIPLVLALAAALLPAALCASPQQMMEAEGFSLSRSKGGQGRATSGWHSPQWRAVQTNLTQQLKNVDGSFSDFQAHRGRRYRSTAERSSAQAKFKANLQYIVAENDRGTNPFILGITNFTDLSYEDFSARYLMAPQAIPKAAGTKGRSGRRLRGESASRQLLQTYQNKTMATSNCSVNWGVASTNPVGKPVVSPVKFQGGCGSCWAFSTAAQLESWTAMQNTTLDSGNFMDLSEQMLVDCSYAAGYDACQGGWPTAAFDFVKANGGIASEVVDPYTSGGTGTYSGSCPSATKPRQLGSQLIKSYTQVTPTNDAGLAAAVQKQPVVTAVAAGPEFQNYIGGAITCNTNTGINHAVQTVGCGYIPSPDGTQQLPVYIIKNSWSSYWGYGGLAWMLRTTEQYGGCMLGSGAYTLS